MRQSVGIIGLGSYVPEKVRTSKDLETMAGVSEEWIVERTGIRERRVAADDQATSDLATRAAEAALADAGVKPEDIDLIIVATVTPDMVFPSVACLVQANLKAQRAAAFDLGAACSGFVYGVVIGCHLLKSGLYKKVLVLGAEVTSRVTDWMDRDTCMLMGDGAGAVVLGELPEGYGLLGADLGSDGLGSDFIKIPAGGTRMPASAETVANRLHYFRMNGYELFKFAMGAMGASAVRALADAGLALANVDTLVPHQANIRIIQAAARQLDLPMEKVFVNIDRYGNTSGASIPLALKDAVDRGRIKKDNMVVMTGFGAGMTWASCVMKWF